MKKKTLFFITVLMLISFHQSLLSQQKIIEVSYKRNDDKTVEINYTKKLPGSYFVKLQFTTLKNCFEQSVESVIKNKTGRLVKLRPTNNKEHITFGYTYSYIRGNPNPKVDSLFVYTLPFLNGKTIKINEAYNLNERYLGSKKPINWKSYVILSKNPDTISAMRKGIVVDVTNNYETDTLLIKNYTSKRNAIKIEHADGTYANYTGFKKNSIFVKLGQTVYPKTKLGVLEIFNKGIYRFSFTLYYLNSSNIERKKNETFKNKKLLNSFITPYFLTENGIEQLKHGQNYIATKDEETFFAEFTRKEKKKYKKDPSKFQ